METRNPVIFYVVMSLLSAIGFALPYVYPHLWIFSWISLSLWLVVLFHVKNWKAAMGYSLVFSVTHFGFMLAFLGSMMPLIGWVTPLLWLGLVVYYSLFFMLFTGIVYRISRTCRFFVVWIPLLWCGFEWMRSCITLFPSPDVYYSQIGFLPLVQLCSITGGSAISALVVLSNTLLAVVALLLVGAKPVSLVNVPSRLRFFRIRRYVVAWIGVMFLVFCIAAWGALRIQHWPSSNQSAVQSVLLIQPNIMQSSKISAIFPLFLFEQQVAMIPLQKSTDCSIIVLPENTVPYVIPTAVIAQRVTDRLQFSDSLIILGIPTKENNLYFNSILVFDQNGEIARYHKQRLIPFGEYLPVPNWLKRRIIHSGLMESEFASDHSLGPVKAHRKTLGLLICSESLYPDIARFQAQAGAQVFVLVLNDAWFLTSSALSRHWNYSRFRAIETARYIVVAGNTGISGVISPVGIEIVKAKANHEAKISSHFRLEDFQTIFVIFPGIFGTFLLMIGGLTFYLERRFALDKKNFR